MCRSYAILRVKATAVISQHFSFLVAFNITEKNHKSLYAATLIKLQLIPFALLKRRWEVSMRGKHQKWWWEEGARGCNGGGDEKCWWNLSLRSGGSGERGRWIESARGGGDDGRWWWECYWWWWCMVLVVRGVDERRASPRALRHIVHQVGSRLGRWAARC